VRRSYRNPLETWSTNVLGTANVLECCRHTESVKAIVVVTTDKCYENLEQASGYRETDRLGGHDPYSASKAAAELVASSYRDSYFKSMEKPLIATGRAGNVIGGGDWSEDRLIPDAARAVSEGRSLQIRSPQATRPWQHVLECLCGYLLLGQKLLQGQNAFASPWNFGPGPDGNQTVSDVLDRMQSHWPNLRWHKTAEVQPHETTLLQLDSIQARQRLGWRPVWSLHEGLTATAEWYQCFYHDRDIASQRQLSEYISAAQKQDLPWALS
jgi:CDP-glucose 4,6-dehydratase